MTSPRDLDAALIAGLAVEAEKLSTAGQELATELHVRGEELKEVADGLKRYQRLVIALSIVAALIIGGLCVIASINLRNGSEIRSCTTPTGACYQRNQANTEVVLGRLLVGFCSGIFAKEPEKAQACVTSAIAALREG